MAGVELTVEGALEGEPTARVLAVNHSDEPAHIEAQLRLYGQAPRRPTSRMITVPQQAWSQPCLVDLAPGESKEIEMVATELPPNHEGYFMLSVGEEHLASARFAPEGLERVAFGNVDVNELDVITF